jgi:hypothetical protein
MDIDRTLTLNDGKHSISYSFYSIYKTERILKKKFSDLGDDPAGFIVWMVFAGLFNENESRTEDEIARLIPSKGVGEILKVCDAVYNADVGSDDEPTPQSEGK